jgi:hypothetical protein
MFLGLGFRNYRETLYASAILWRGHKNKTFFEETKMIAFLRHTGPFKKRPIFKDIFHNPDIFILLFTMSLYPYF